MMIMMMVMVMMMMMMMMMMLAITCVREYDGASFLSDVSRVRVGILLCAIRVEGTDFHGYDRVLST